MVPEGEQAKSRAEWTRLSDQLLDLGFGRDAAIIALGGGVVGDLAGFVAATYLRGVPVVQVPTTLVAMVDAAIGGKTGVDTGHGKNLIGAFHQPAAVVADPRCLLTLTDRNYRSGLAEAVKHAIIADHQYFGWLDDNAEGVAGRDLKLLAPLVETSVRIKAEVVTRDEREAGPRAHLNLGHTIGHGIEQASGYRLRHGEAVALGLVAETSLAANLGLAPRDLPPRVKTLLDRLGLPVALTEPLRPDVVLNVMGYDKKASRGTIRFSLPSAVGAMAGTPAAWTVPVTDQGEITAAMKTIGIG